MFLHFAITVRSLIVVQRAYIMYNEWVSDAETDSTVLVWLENYFCTFDFKFWICLALICPLVLYKVLEI